MNWKTFIAVSVLGLFIVSTARANNSSILHRITDKIASIKNLIHRDTRKRLKLQNDLEKTETHSSEISKRLTSTKGKLKEQQILLDNLTRSEEQYQETLKIQQEHLDQQIQMAYMLGREPYLKLLLNQENTGEISRILMYYHFINQARAETITEMQQTILQIEENEKKIQNQYQTLQDLQDQQMKQKIELSAEQKNRKNLLDTLNKDIQTRQQRLDVLIENKRELEKTIARAARTKVNFPTANISEIRDHLHWPTRGKLLALFGTQIEQSELRWGGVLIEAPEGEPVYAVAKGKVVFARWLSGYGLMLIINHGNGYMTLYGRNHVLYKKEGDIVQHGDLIATVGQTGGYEKPALYFGVCRNGEAINPALFVSKEKT